MKICMTGGTGLLGKELLKRNSDIINISRDVVDLSDFDQLDILEVEINRIKPDIFIHSAAFTSPPKCNVNPELARTVNIASTVAITNACQKHNIRLVYISTDYVFDGITGNYSTQSPINPLNIYAMTKAAGELAVRTYRNSLVIRTSFCEHEFPYENALVDQYTHRDYVDIIAPMIYDAAISDKIGIKHIGTELKTVYDLAKRRKPNVGEIKLSQLTFFAPKYLSFAQHKDTGEFI